MKSSRVIEDLLPYLTLVHSSPGRLRVRVSRELKNRAGELSVEKADDIIAKIDGIKEVKFNSLIGSITILYDNDIFPKELWDDLLAGRNLEKIYQIIDRERGKFEK